MGVASSPGSQRPQPTRHSVWFGFTTTVIVPVCCMLVLWGLLVGFTPSGALIRSGLLSHGHHGLDEIAVQAAAAVIIVLAAILLMGLFARRLQREISSLEGNARHLADVQLPQIMKSLRGDGQPADADQDLETPATRIREIAGVAAAITSLRHTAVGAAADEASLRNGIAQVFVSLARRNQSLLQRQLHLIDALEHKAADPGALADLFSLDHLTTRMRRHAENLIILSGASPGRSWSDPVPVIDVIRGAMAEVEDYQRVRVLTRSQDAVIGSAVADMIHLLAELIENATLFSPSGTRVEVRAERVANGFVVEVEDRGLGIQPDRLAEINQNLANPPDFALADPDRLGLFVVGKLAARHAIGVSLNPSPYGGTTAVMLIPHSVVVPVAVPRPEISAAERPGISAGDHHGTGAATSEPAGPGRWSEESVTPAGRRSSVLGPAADEADQRWLSPASPDRAARVQSPDWAAQVQGPDWAAQVRDPDGPSGRGSLPEPGDPLAARAFASPFPVRTSGPPTGGGTSPPATADDADDPLASHIRAERWPGGDDQTGAGAAAGWPADSGASDRPAADAGAGDLWAGGSGQPAGLGGPEDGRGGDHSPAAAPPLPRRSAGGLGERGAHPQTAGFSPTAAGAASPPWAGPVGSGSAAESGGPLGDSGRLEDNGRLEDRGGLGDSGSLGPGSAGWPLGARSGSPLSAGPAGGPVTRGSGGSLFGTGGPGDTAGPAGPGVPAAGGADQGAGGGAPWPAGETAGPAAGEHAAGTYRGLPRRVRQASLSAHLKARGAADTAPLHARAEPALPADRTPEQARDVVASFRSGWQRPPQADAPVTHARTGTGETGQDDSGPPDAQPEAHREETQWTSPARPDPEHT